ncbi:hypothetical protein [Bradyrhizobium sp. 163]
MKDAWTVQPDFQYIVRGRATLPGPARCKGLRNCSASGLRTTLDF